MVPTGQPAGEVPDGTWLAPDERLLRHVGFRRSNLNPWFPVGLALTNRRLEVRRRSLFLGLVPVGSTKLTYPLPNVASVQADTHTSILGLVVGLIAVLAGLLLASAGLLPPPVESAGRVNPAAVVGAGILVVLLGAYVFVSAFWSGLVITNNAGQPDRHRVAFTNRRAAGQFASEIGRALAALNTQVARPGVAPGP